MSDRDAFRAEQQARRIHGLKARHETRDARAASRLPEHIRGDGPCSNCGTRNNPIWFTESVFWNAVVRVEPRLTDDAEILCMPCFIIMADQRGYRCHWRLLPEWHWETKDEAAARREIGSRDPQ